MPRQARIDAPGALHHVMCRGIERRDIFRDTQDRRNFVERLGRAVSETATSCLAWCLMPNHFHLLLRTGQSPISGVMRRVLTGYAVTFNRKHQRSGHLFQNRYKSILCQEEPALFLGGHRIGSCRHSGRQTAEGCTVGGQQGVRKRCQRGGEA